MPPMHQLGALLISAIYITATADSSVSHYKMKLPDFPWVVTVLSNEGGADSNVQVTALAGLLNREGPRLYTAGVEWENIKVVLLQHFSYYHGAGFLEKTRNINFTTMGKTEVYAQARLFAPELISKKVVYSWEEAPIAIPSILTYASIHGAIPVAKEFDDKPELTLVADLSGMFADNDSDGPSHFLQLRNRGIFPDSEMAKNDVMLLQEPPLLMAGYNVDLIFANKMWAFWMDGICPYDTGGGLKPYDPKATTLFARITEGETAPAIDDDAKSFITLMGYYGNRGHNEVPGICSRTHRQLTLASSLCTGLSFLQSSFREGEKTGPPLGDDKKEKKKKEEKEERARGPGVENRSSLVHKHKGRRFLPAEKSSKAPRPPLSLHQIPVKPVKYNPQKAYVTLITSDGDNLNYDSGPTFDMMRQRLDLCKKHGEEGGSSSSRSSRKSSNGRISRNSSCPPLSWTLSPRLLDYAPVYAEWFYYAASETENDSFLFGPSGYSYGYPSQFDPLLLAAFANLTTKRAAEMDIIATIESANGHLGNSTAARHRAVLAYNSSKIRGVFTGNMDAVSVDWHMGDVGIIEELPGHDPYHSYPIDPDYVLACMRALPSGALAQMTVITSILQMKAIQTIAASLPPHVELVGHREALELLRQRTALVKDGMIPRPAAVRDAEEEEREIEEAQDNRGDYSEIDRTILASIGVGILTSTVVVLWCHYYCAVASSEKRQSNIL